MPTLAVPLRDMVMEQIHADRLILSGGHGDSCDLNIYTRCDNADIHMFTRSTRGEYARTELMRKLRYQFSILISVWTKIVTKPSNLDCDIHYAARMLDNEVISCAVGIFSNFVKFWLISALHSMLWETLFGCLGLGFTPVQEGKCAQQHQQYKSTWDVGNRTGICNQRWKLIALRCHLIHHFILNLSAFIAAFVSLGVGTLLRNGEARWLNGHHKERQKRKLEGNNPHSLSCSSPLSAACQCWDPRRLSIVLMRFCDPWLNT